MKTLFVLCLLLALSACNLPGTPEPPFTPTPGETGTATVPALPSPTASPDATGTATTPALPSPTPTTPTTTPTSGTEQPPLPEESILILSPGPGSRLLPPVRVSGVAGPTFESALVVRILAADGTELALVPVTIDAEMGQRGPFQADVPVTVSELTQAFIQVYSTSPRDGGLTHLSSVGVTITPDGWQEIKPLPSQLERIVIYQPTLNAVVTGGVAHVEGFGLASFEQTLVADVLDADGQVVGSQPLLVDSPELGEPGPFRVDVPYSVTAPGPGRIVVRDPSAAFEGDVHLSSVEINLEP